MSTTVMKKRGRPSGSDSKSTSSKRKTNIQSSPIVASVSNIAEQINAASLAEITAEEPLETFLDYLMCEKKEEVASEIEMMSDKERHNLRNQINKYAEFKKLDSQPAQLNLKAVISKVDTYENVGMKLLKQKEVYETKMAELMEELNAHANLVNETAAEFDKVALATVNQIINQVDAAKPFFGVIFIDDDSNDVDSNDVVDAVETSVVDAVETSVVDVVETSVVDVVETSVVDVVETSVVNAVETSVVDKD